MIPCVQWIPKGKEETLMGRIRETESDNECRFGEANAGDDDKRRFDEEQGQV